MAEMGLDSGQSSEREMHIAIHLYRTWYEDTRAHKFPLNRVRRMNFQVSRSPELSFSWQIFQRIQIYLNIHCALDVKFGEYLFNK